MLNIFSGARPDLTPVQVLAAIPGCVALAHALGLVKLSDQQHRSLGNATICACVLSVSDALLRIGRNLADAKSQAAALLAPHEFPAPAPADPEHEQLLAIGEDLPSDEQELAAPPPSAGPPSG